MADLFGVDMSDAKELGEGFTVVPPGDYHLFVVESDRVTTKSGTGEYLQCKIQIASGPHEGAWFYERFNLWNPNAQAVDIAKSQWRALCEVTLGQPNAINNDSSSLHSKIFLGEVDNIPMNKDDPNSKRSNCLVFRKGKLRSLIGGSAPTPQTVPPITTQATAQPHVATGKPPWKK